MRTLLAQAEEHPLFSVDAADRCGRSLLWYAAVNGHLQATALLLERRADVACRDLVGWMPLHHACYHGSTELVRLLLERKAEVDSKTNAGQTPRWLAPSETHAEIAALLEELGGTLGLPPRDWVNPRQTR